MIFNSNASNLNKQKEKRRKKPSKVEPALPAKKPNWQASHARDVGLGDFEAISTATSEEDKQQSQLEGEERKHCMEMM